MALTLLGQHNPLASSTEQLKILGGTTSCPPFETQLDQIGLFPLRATEITVFQINVGKLCNQTCR
ncbi:MAG TPA: radical SAM protein, partial [Nitrospiraceae bacterium]|nr:radical SAM protein [Nitrospiraceae bacterium]